MTFYDLFTKIINKLNLAVRTDKQALSEEQKLQARENIGAGMPQIQADQNQNDETAPDYIKNRLAWTEDEVGEVIFEHTMTNFDENIPDTLIGLEIGEKYLVTYNDAEYNLTAKKFVLETNTLIYLGNMGIVTGVDTGEPFFIADDITRNFVGISAGNNETISVRKITETIHQIDPRYYERLAWSEQKENILFDDMITIVEGLDTQENLIGLQEGYNYIVSWNDTEYNCECIKTIDDNGVEGCILGNLGISGAGNDTGEPFVIADVKAEHVSDGDVCFIKTTSGDGDYALSVIEIEEIIHRINPKYLPEGGFGYIEGEEKIVFPETDIVLTEGPYMQIGNIGLQEGRSYIVNWNGTEYETTCSHLKNGNFWISCIGNKAALGMGDTGEPFIIADGYEDGEYFFMILGDVGNYTISIKEFEVVIHKIDKKFMPTVIDYEENNIDSPSYIANRPCYNGMLEIDTKKLSKSGAAIYHTGGVFNSYVKALDYIPDGDWVYRILTNSSSTNEKIELGCQCTCSKREYGWILSSTDVVYFYAITEEAVKNSIKTDIGIVSEPGIYAGFVSSDTINLFPSYFFPMIKTLDKSMLSIDYNDLNNIPLGEERKELLFHSYENSSIFFDKANIHNNSSQYRFRLISHNIISQTDIIGATLILSDGTEKIVNNEDLTVTYYGDNNQFLWEINNLLISKDIPNITIGDYQYRGNFPIKGIYTSDSTGVYVVDITLPTKIKQLDEKFIPDTIPKVETAEIGQTLIVKSIDEYGKPTEWETMTISFTEADALTLVVETGLVDIVSDENGAVLKDENDKFVII